MRDTELEQSAQPTILDRIPGLWRRRKWIAVLAFTAPAAVVVGLVTSLPNIYRSSATVLVERQQVPEAFVKPTVTGELDTRLHTISQEILSRSRLEGLITRFNLYSRLRQRLSPEELVTRMRNDIVLEVKSDERAQGRIGKTIAFAISYRGSDPATVAQVTNTLASFYIEENLKVRARQATGTADFLRAQLEETKKQLDIQERRVSEYNRRYLGELPQQMATNLAALEQLNTQLRLNGDRQTLTLARREVLDRQLTDAATLGPRAGQAPERHPAAPDTPAIRLDRLRQELTQLRSQYTEKYPEVSRVKAEIAAVEREQSETKSEAPPDAPPVTPPDPAVRRLKESLAEVDAELKALKNDEQRLKDAITLYQARVERTPRREQEIQEVSRDYQTTRDHYQTLLKRYQEAQLAEDMEQRQKGEQFRVLDPALAANEPAAPNRLRLLAMGLALTLGLTAGAVVLAEQFDTSFHSVGELRAFTDIPVLVSIPRIVTASDARARRRRACAAIVAMIAGLLILAGSSHFIGRDNERLARTLSGNS